VKRILLVGALLVSAIALLPMSVDAQDRIALLRQAQTAYDDFDPPRALRIARAALDPALGPLDSTWVRGVHLLAQILIEEQQADAAKTWARWAMRARPDLPIDSVNFLAGVVTTLRAARTEAPRTVADDKTTPTYTWPGANATTAESRIRVASSSSQLNVLVRGVGLVGPEGLVVPPGTYELEVSGTGLLPLRVTREALPGVATSFAFNLTPAAAAAMTLAADVRARVFAATVPLSIARFGAPQAACAAGVASGGERLVLTSYQAIRGADAVTANGEVKVAAWDVASNLAVLVLPAAAATTLASTADILDGQALWAVSLAECRTPAESRVVLQGWEGRPLGALALSEAPANAAIGSPLVDYRGNFAGTWSGGNRAAPASVIAPLLARARENVVAQRTLTAQQVAVQENHRYGSVVIAADVPNATVKLTPLEAWQWTELTAQGVAPFSFRGAAGRYRVDASAPGVAARTQEVVVRAGETTRSAISLRAVAAVPAGPAVREKKGIPKWVWAVGIGGVAAAAALGGGGGGGGSSGGVIEVVVTP